MTSNYNRANAPCVWKPTPITSDVIVTKIAGYVCVRILMNRWFFRIFGIHTFYATATLLSTWICMPWTDAADGGCGGGLDFAYRLAAAARRPLLMTTGPPVWTLNPSGYNLPYTGILRNTHWRTLPGTDERECSRRLRGDQIEVFKILNGYENIDTNIFLKLRKVK